MLGDGASSLFFFLAVGADGPTERKARGAGPLFAPLPTGPPTQGRTTAHSDPCWSANSPPAPSRSRSVPGGRNNNNKDLSKRKQLYVVLVNVECNSLTAKPQLFLFVFFSLKHQLSSRSTIHFYLQKS